ncbi:MAG: MFS transporter [Caulobacterales bacterium]|nr:MFS transporter [Caulobacterales bacterium]
MTSETRPVLTLAPRSFGILFSISIIVAVGNTGLMSILPAIGRQIGIPDTYVAAIFSLSALLWAVMSPIWARESDKRGRKPLIMLGLGGFTVSMACCGLVVTAGLHHLAPWTTIFVVFLLARAVFGLIGSASNPATQAYLAERTARADRTQQMAGLAGAFGLGTVVGPFLAPLFILPVVTLAGPLFAFALIAAAMLFVVWRYLPEAKLSRDQRRFSGAGVGLWSRVQQLLGRLRHPVKLVRDIIAAARVSILFPFLVYGFLVATCQTAQGYTLTFMIIDKLKISPVEALGFIAVSMAAGAMAGLLAQWGLIRMFNMGPKPLLRWGVALACLGNLITAFAPDYWTVVAGYAISCLGYGFARPGFTAGASLAVKMGDQAKAAGWIAAVNGLNVIIAPLFVELYRHFHPGPFMLNAVILAGLLAFALKNTILRAAGETGDADEEATLAILERSDEGGV